MIINFINFQGHHFKWLSCIWICCILIFKASQMIFKWWIMSNYELWIMILYVFSCTAWALGHSCGLTMDLCSWSALVIRHVSRIRRKDVLWKCKFNEAFQSVVLHNAQVSPSASCWVSMMSNFSCEDKFWFTEVKNWGDNVKIYRKEWIHIWEGDYLFDLVYIFGLL